MAKLVGKGTVFNQYISTVYTAVAQIISITLPDVQSETYEADTLDNSDYGIPYEPTKRVEGGSFGMEVFLDPALAGHQSLIDVIENPISPAANTKTDMQLKFSDASATAWSFHAAGGSMGGSIQLSDGVKANFTWKVNKIPTFP